MKAASSLNRVTIRGKYLTSAPIPTTKREKNNLFPSTSLSYIPFPATSQVHRYGLENQILVLLLMNCLFSSFYQEADRELGPHEAPGEEARGAGHQG